MNNTIEIENKKRIALKGVVALLVLFCILSAVMLYTFSGIDKKNLSGRVMEVTGKLEYAPNEDDSLVQISGTLYTVGGIDDHYDISTLNGQQVTLVIPIEVFGDANPWILGIKKDGVTLVDYTEVIAAKKQSNDVGKYVSLAILCAFVLAAVAVNVWRNRLVPTQQANLAEQFANYFSIRQPSCKQRKLPIIVMFAWLAALVVYSIVLGLVAPDSIAHPLSITLIAIMVVLLGGGITAIALTIKYAYNKEIEFYTQGFPFNFRDISHIRLKKTVKQQLQESLEKESAQYPHRYGDGGNGFDVQFGQEGIDLYLLEEMTEEQRMMQTNEQADQEVFDGVTPPDQFRHVMHLDYSQLNLQALPLIKKGEKPLMVVIQSQLEPSLATDELAHDLHMLLDTNLLDTLRTFNVPVANLDYVLENKQAIMQEHCKKVKGPWYTLVK